MRPVRRGLLIACFCLLAVLPGTARGGEPADADALVEVVVSLAQKPLATTRWLAAAVPRHKRWPRPRTLAERIETAVPQAQVRWRYRLVANGLAVVLPRSELARSPRSRCRAGLLERPLPDPARSQHAADWSAALWAPGLANAGEGDQDRDHRRGDRPETPVLRAGRLHDARGLPEGPGRLHDCQGDRRQGLPPPGRPGSTLRSRSTPSTPRTARTSPASRPATPTRSPRESASPARAARVPRQLQGSDDPDRRRRRAGRELAGARRRDRGGGRRRYGRDQHVARRTGDRALPRHRRPGARSRCPGRCRLGRLGRERLRGLWPRLGRLPASAPEAITVGAVSTTRSGPEDVVASFSSSGPDTALLRLKPELSAPGVSIKSAAPRRLGDTVRHEHGRAPRRRRRCSCSATRPGPRRRSSRRSLTGDGAFADQRKRHRAVDVSRGGGVVSLPRADTPLVFASPVALSFGLVSPGATLTQQVELSDAGGGAGPWSVSVAPQSRVASVTVSVPPSVTASLR